MSAPLISFAQNVTEYVPADSLNVGDQINYTLTLDKTTTYDDVIFPDSSHFGSSFEIRSVQRFKVTDFKDSLIYRLQFFGTSDTTIPELPVKLVEGNDTTAVYTRQAPIYFKSVLQSDEEEFRPFKPIFDFAAAWWPYILLLILLGVAGWYLYQWYQKKEAQPAPQPKPEFNPEPFNDPLNQLESSLKQLQSFTFESQKDFDQFYVNLGDAIRLYFERLHNIPALESTSSEMMYELNRRSMDEELLDQTRKVLNEADMVKFAKFTPTEDQAQKALNKGEAFLKKAKKIDGPKVNHLRRQHNLQIERQKQAFEQEQKENTEE